MTEDVFVSKALKSLWEEVENEASKTEMVTKMVENEASKTEMVMKRLDFLWEDGKDQKQRNIDMIDMIKSLKETVENNKNDLENLKQKHLTQTNILMVAMKDIKEEVSKDRKQIHDVSQACVKMMFTNSELKTRMENLSYKNKNMKNLLCFITLMNLFWAIIYFNPDMMTIVDRSCTVFHESVSTISTGISSLKHSRSFISCIHLMFASLNVFQCLLEFSKKLANSVKYGIKKTAILGASLSYSLVGLLDLTKQMPAPEKEAWKGMTEDVNVLRGYRQDELNSTGTHSWYDKYEKIKIMLEKNKGTTVKMASKGM